MISHTQVVALICVATIRQNDNVAHLGALCERNLLVEGTTENLKAYSTVSTQPEQEVITPYLEVKIVQFCGHPKYNPL